MHDVTVNSATHHFPDQPLVRIRQNVLYYGMMKRRVLKSELHRSCVTIGWVPALTYLRSRSGCPSATDHS